MMLIEKTAYDSPLSMPQQVVLLVILTVVLIVVAIGMCGCGKNKEKQRIQEEADMAVALPPVMESTITPRKQPMKDAAEEPQRGHMPHADAPVDPHSAISPAGPRNSYAAPVGFQHPRPAGGGGQCATDKEPPRNSYVPPVSFKQPRPSGGGGLGATDKKPPPSSAGGDKFGQMSMAGEYVPESKLRQYQTLALGNSNVFNKGGGKNVAQDAQSNKAISGRNVDQGGGQFVADAAMGQYQTLAMAHSDVFKKD